MRILQKETNIGLIRETNEDAAVAISHPQDKDTILLIVADGMGGKEFGEIASFYVAENIEKWFCSNTPTLLNDRGKVEDQLENLISKLNKNLIDKFGRNIAGTTLSLAIVTASGTILVNIGDSRIYIYRKRKLIQVSEDSSDVWYYYKYGAVKKDDLRYFYNNNIITSCVGLSEELCQIDIQMIDNDYDMILLFSDGVTDLITDKKIKKLIDTSSKEEILKNIINEAVYVDQHLHIPLRLKQKAYSKYILPFKGRDNATGVIYIKK